MSTQTTGGFAGDPAAAFTPPASTGCCGTAPTTAAPAPTAATTCCGTAEATAEAGTCCDPAAKADALAQGAGCCG